MKNTLQKPPETKPFKPSEKMQLWLDTSIELATTNKSAVSEKCGVDRSMWYDWIKKPGFEDWYFEEYKKLRRRWLPVLDEAGLRMAIRSEKGYSHWKDLRKAAGEVDEPQVNINNLQGLVQVNINGND